ncbi:MAG: sulfatase-like hydrolase/transferase [Verrucomicrobiota bacterium]
MKMRNVLLAMVIGGLVVGSSFGVTGEARHILLIMADDLGIEGLGCYGGTDYETPRLDELAATGVRFTHAYSQPLCTPTRIEIMTGKENHRNWQYFGILPPEERTFGHLMQDLGYKTCIAGKWQLQSYDPPDFPNAERRRGTGMHPKDGGFDGYSLFHSLHTEDKGSRFANPTYLRDGELVEEVEGAYGEDEAVDYIVSFWEANGDNRTFVYFPMALPHWPMVPTPDSEEWADEGRRLEESTEYFPDMVAYMDKLVGRLVDELDRLGMREETLVMFYSDNGTDARITSHIGDEVVAGGKATPLQTGIRVPLIANWPGVIGPGVCGDLVEASDFLPTLAALAGGEVPTDWHTDGVSFAPQLFGGKGTPREWAFFWYDPRPGWDKQRFTRSIFALDHGYKLYSDGRIFDIAGETMREVELDTGDLSPEAEAAREKLQGAIDEMMSKGPISHAAKVEVDAYGEPL